MNFGQAVEELKNGKKVCRGSSNWKDFYLELRTETSISSSSHICIDTKRPNKYLQSFVPWIPTPADMLAEDWEVLG